MHILDFIFPQRCVSCKKIGKYICSACIKKIEYITQPICPVCSSPAIGGATHPRCMHPWGIDGMYAATHYRGPIKKAIHLLKYRYVSDVVETLVKLLIERYPKTLPPLDCLVPVPLFPKREKYRGFNQSFLIAQLLSRYASVPVDKRCLTRNRMTLPQADLPRSRRLANVRGVFACGEDCNLQDKSVGLVDDVATTMTTLSECAKVLKRSGAKRVWGIVLAHG